MSLFVIVAIFVAVSAFPDTSAVITPLLSMDNLSTDEVAPV